MNIRVGEAVDLQADKRYIQHTRDHAIGDVYDALVELITNADDSYNRLFLSQKRNRDGGDILVEHLEQRRGQRSFIVVRDKAEGMNADAMKTCLLRFGASSVAAGNRGYMGRGAKDCSALGDVTFESIKDDRYYKCRVTHDLKFVLDVNAATATRQHRESLGVAHGNGTTVTIELTDNVPIPRFDNIATELPWHYAMRDIMSESSDSRVQLRRLGDSRSKPVALVWRPPEGELVCDISFDVEGYPGAKPHLVIWKAPESLDADNPRFERAGILIKGARAIHECSLLTDEFKKNPYALRYFGRLECPYIDQLLQDYEVRRGQGVLHPPENPRLLIDPNRRFGLERRHPFVQRLLQIPSEQLRALLAKDREQDKSKQQEIANDETRSRLDRLAKLAGRFLRQQLDELEELSTGEAVDDEMFTKRGVLIYPTYLNVGIGNERTLTVYVRRSLLANVQEPVTIETDSADALEVSGSPFSLHSHKTKEDRLLGSFKVTGKKLASGVVLTAKCNGLPAAEALVQVVENTIEEHNFITPPLEFERDEYRVRHGSRKSLRLFAKYPDLVDSDTEVEAKSADSSKVVVRGKCLLTPISGSNYAEGFVTIEGRVLKSKVTITAEVNGRTATTTVKVIDRSDEDRSIPLKIELRDEDYGNFRAKWAEHEGKPHLLLISARHKSLARYLGPAEKQFPGQNSPIFRVLLAEIVAESVCRKALTMEAKERPWDFRWADLKEDHLIADDVLAKLQQRMREFVVNAHASMVSDQDVKAAQSLDV